jgi:hypothetical protein
MSLLVINSSSQLDDADLRKVFAKYQILSDILSAESIVHFNFGKLNTQHRTDGKAVSFPAPIHLLNGYPVRVGYDVQQFRQRLNDSQAKYFILRPDGIIYAKARSLSDLEDCLKKLEINFG